MKKLCAILLALVLELSMGVCIAETFADEIIETRTTRAFADEEVNAADLQKIVQAGLAATSAMNAQPWYFAVVTNKEVMAELSTGGFGAAPTGDSGAPQGNPPENLADAPEGADLPVQPAAGGGAKAGVGDSPVAIVIYMDPNSKSTNAAFDCGLACQNMVNAAVALGYGTKIVSSPTIVLNGDRHDELCELLNVDTSLTAVAVLLIGYESDAIDAVSSASARQSTDEKVSFVE